MGDRHRNFEEQMLWSQDVKKQNLNIYIFAAPPFLLKDQNSLFQNDYTGQGYQVIK
jgi:hypothetical protein